MPTLKRFKKLPNNPKRCVLSLLVFSTIFSSTHFSEAIAIKKQGIPTVLVYENIMQGLERLYNLEFKEAEVLFSKMIQENPNNPLGYFYLAMVSWSYLTFGFWTEAVVTEYGKRIDQAISVAKKNIRNGEDDCYTYFYLGGALGFKGRLKLMHRNYLASFFLALEAVDALKTSHTKCPGNRDVLFGLGIFDYYTARMSGVLKFLSFLLIHKGDKQEGLRKLHSAADGALYSSLEAKSLLVDIYLYMENRQYQKALPIAKELAERFEKNPRYKFFEGIAYIRLSMDSKYREVVDFLIKKSKEEPLKEKACIWLNRAYYLDASYSLFHGQYQEARSKLDTIMSQTDPLTDPSMVAWPLLKKGMSYDLETQREKALNFYQQVLSLKNGAGAQFLAHKYIDEAAKRRNPFLGY